MSTAIFKNIYCNIGGNLLQQKKAYCNISSIGTVTSEKTSVATKSTSTSGKSAATNVKKLLQHVKCYHCNIRKTVVATTKKHHRNIPNH